MFASSAQAAAAVTRQVKTCHVHPLHREAVPERAGYRRDRARRRGGGRGCHHGHQHDARACWWTRRAAPPSWRNGSGRDLGARAEAHRAALRPRDRRRGGRSHHRDRRRAHRDRRRGDALRRAPPASASARRSSTRGAEAISLILQELTAWLASAGIRCLDDIRGRTRQRDAAAVVTNPPPVPGWEKSRA